jgi:hemolysin D
MGIGFMRAGQRITVKFESFQFARYRVMCGDGQLVQPEAMADEKVGLYYAARVGAKQDNMNIDRAGIPLSRGMATTAEVLTGKGGLIRYLLSPVVQHPYESGKER